ncbi:Arc family DNA-binding protein [Acetobacteraceae bacterium B3987]|nr:Arc family DNA-binding protein [Acetobacteraceae bacterium B3987]
MGEELLHEVRISAAHNGHSMNAEMIRLVRLALKENPPGTIHTSESVPPSIRKNQQN